MLGIGNMNNRDSGEDHHYRHQRERKRLTRRKEPKNTTGETGEDALRTKRDEQKRRTALVENISIEPRENKYWRRIGSKKAYLITKKTDSLGRGGKIP